MYNIAGDFLSNLGKSGVGKRLALLASREVKEFENDERAMNDNDRQISDPRRPAALTSENGNRRGISGVRVSP